MAAIPHYVAEAFKRQEHATSGHFYSTGDAIYSYAMKLAHWGRVLGEDAIMLDYQPRELGGTAPSVTTARHMRALEACLDFEHSYLSSAGAYGAIV